MKRRKMKGFVLRVQGDYVGMVFADRVERTGIEAGVEQIYAWAGSRIVFSASSSARFPVELVGHVEANAPAAEKEPHCPWCEEGNPRVRSSVTDAWVHTDTPVGRQVCRLSAPRANGRPEQPAASAVESHSKKESGSSDV